MSRKLRQFPFRVVPLPKGFGGGPSHFDGGISDDHLSIQRDRDPLSRVGIEVALSVALVEVVVPGGDPDDQLLELRRLVRYPGFNETPVLATHFLACSPRLFLFDVHAVPPEMILPPC